MRAARARTASSSSTTRTAPETVARGVRAEAGDAATAGALSTGKSTSNVVPRPTALVTEIAPPLWVTMPSTVASPSPVPLPFSLVVKKGSNARRRVASSIPKPESVTESATWGPGERPVRSAACSESRATVEVRKTSRPPSGIASRALMARFITT